MAEPFIGEIRIFSGTFAPKGWSFCNGQVLSIQQNQALFSILGTTYGGDGIRTFALPNLQGRTPLGTGGGIPLGASAGESTHTLLLAELPMHTHFAQATTNAPTDSSPANNLWAANEGLYALATSSPVPLAATAIGSAGGNQPHPNQQPALTLNFIIALVGIFPSRS